MKIQVLLFAGACLALVACGDKKEPANSGDAAKAVQMETVSVEGKQCPHAAKATMAEGSHCANKAVKAETASAEGKHCAEHAAKAETASAEGSVECADPNCSAENCPMHTASAEHVQEQENE